MTDADLLHLIQRHCQRISYGQDVWMATEADMLAMLREARKAAQIVTIRDDGKWKAEL